ncbi:TetR/AcrR family transcriptional regulator [Porphyromonadaceae bacterium W3.11]|nr:TetR/AcrR family transcriptional regulator [Porphyromonadaceae bacterium W3.11]
MQILKTDTRQRIVSIAHNEFIKNGVRQTTIRTIASKAGITVGNLYHYFSSKDELFCEVLKPLLSALDSYILSHNREEYLSLAVFNLRESQNEYLYAMLELIETYRAELRLLLFNAEGTSLAGYKEIIINYQMEIGYEYLRLMKQRYPHLNTNISPFLIHITSSSWMTLFCELIEHEDYSQEEIRLALDQYVSYGLAGWKELMKP